MKFHWLDKNGKSDGTGHLKFGANTGGVTRSKGGKLNRPAYVTIGRREIEDLNWTEDKIVRYMIGVRKSLALGGKIYIEATV